MNSMGNMTICVRCRYHLCRDPTRNGRDMWYNHRCGHPEVERLDRPIEIDPVTGRPKELMRDDDGKMYDPGEAHPYCRDINKGGNCQYYRYSILSHVADAIGGLYGGR